DCDGLGNPVRWLLQEAIGLHFQTPAAIARIAFKLALDPFPRRSNAMPRRDRSRVLRRKRKPRLKAHQFFNVGWNAFPRDLLQSCRNLWINGRGRSGLSIGVSQKQGTEKNR